MQRRSDRVLAVASGGGHWVQLMRLRPVLLEANIAFATVNSMYSADVPNARFYVFRDATRWNPIGLIIQAIQLAWIVIRERPTKIISTGAAPGYIAIRMGKILGAKTCWLDSIANVEVLSMAGQKAGPHCDLWLTQWKSLARHDGPDHKGSVL